MRLSRHVSRLFLIALFMAVANSGGAQTASTYPNKRVRVILPFAPGSSADAVTRIFADRFSKDLGQTFIVDNRVGGDGVIATTIAAKADPDGYTLHVNTPNYLVTHWLQPNLTFNSLRDLTPISMLARADWMLAAHPSFPADTLKEFMSYTKANPGKVNMASSGSIAILMYHMLMNATGSKVTLVNYKGGTQPITDLMAGRIDGAFAGVGVLGPVVKSGKAKGLAIASAQRNPAFPNVPTFAEAGLKDFEPFFWWVLLAPSKTPNDIIAKMNSQVRKAQEAPEVIAALANQSSNPYPTSVAAGQTFIRTEAARLGKVIQDSGLKPEDIN